METGGSDTPAMALCTPFRNRRPEGLDPALSCAAALSASLSRLLPLRASRQLCGLGAWLGRRLQEPQQEGIAALLRIILAIRGRRLRSVSSTRHRPKVVIDSETIGDRGFRHPRLRAPWKLSEPTRDDRSPIYAPSRARSTGARLSPYRSRKDAQRPGRH